MTKMWWKLVSPPCLFEDSNFNQNKVAFHQKCTRQIQWITLFDRMGSDGDRNMEETWTSNRPETVMAIAGSTSA